MKKAVLFVAVAVALLWSVNAHAAFIEVNSGYYYGYTGSMGDGRAQGFKANDTFAVSKIGMYADLVSKTYEIAIYNSPDGHSAGSVITTFSQNLGGTGKGWNDMNVNFNFIKDNFYVVNWRNQGGGGLHSEMDYYYDDPLPMTIGPLTLLEGYSGYNAENPANYLHPNFRYDTGAVPLPSALLLFGPGLAGLAAIRRRFKK